MPNEAAPRTARAARLNRRRYLEIVKMLKEVISNPKAGIAQRMRAAETLLGVYDRHDKAQERKQRMHAPVTQAEAAQPVTQVETQVETQADECQTDNDDAIDRAFAFLKRGKATDAV